MPRGKSYNSNTTNTNTSSNTNNNANHAFIPDYDIYVRLAADTTYYCLPPIELTQTIYNHDPVYLEGYGYLLR